MSIVLIALSIATLALIGAWLTRPNAPTWATRAQQIHDFLFRHVAMKRTPDFVVGLRTDPYLLRWWLIPRNPIFNVYLHCFMRSDDDRALHDHPWYSLSLALDGRMIEHTDEPHRGRVLSVIEPGDWRWRAPEFAHRLELPAHQVMVPRPGGGTQLVNESPRPAWTLFFTGPRLREWGFHCQRGWVHWEKFTETVPGHSITGRGCD